MLGLMGMSMVEVPADDGPDGECCRPGGVEMPRRGDSWPVGVPTIYYALCMCILYVRIMRNYEFWPRAQHSTLPALK